MCWFMMLECFFFGAPIMEAKRKDLPARGQFKAQKKKVKTSEKKIDELSTVQKLFLEV